MFDAWLEFAQQASDPVAYSYAVIPHKTMATMGKTLPPEIRRDSGILHTSSSAATTSRTRHVANKSEGEHDDDSSVQDSEDDSSRGSVHKPPRAGTIAVKRKLSMTPDAVYKRNQRRKTKESHRGM